MKYLDNEHLRQLSGKTYLEVPEVILGINFDIQDRKDIALSIQRIAKRALGSTEEFRTSKLVFVNNEWIYK